VLAPPCASPNDRFETAHLTLPRWRSAMRCWSWAARRFPSRPPDRSENTLQVRLWTFHPRYLDPQGLVALWREALLARVVLLGRTRGYAHHPQLLRFQQQPDPPRPSHDISAMCSMRLRVAATSSTPRRSPPLHPHAGSSKRMDRSCSSGTPAREVQPPFPLRQEASRTRSDAGGTSRIHHRLWLNRLLGAPPRR